MSFSSKLLLVLALVLLLVPRSARADETCASDWKKRAFTTSRDSVVRVEPVGMSIEGLLPMGGFVYPTRSHVIVPAEAVGVGRGARVFFTSGQEIAAHAVAIDETSGIAILALDAEAPAPPLDLGDAQLAVGDAIASVSAFDAKATIDAWLQIGHVANPGDRGVLGFDGAPAPVRGSPVFACDGTIVAFRRNSVLVPASAIRALASSRAPKPLDDKRWSFMHAHAGLLFQADDDRPYIGGSFGGAATYADRLQLRLGLGILAGLQKQSETYGPDHVDVLRLQMEPTIGYRILLTRTAPLYVVPQVGAVGRVDFVDRTHVAFSPVDLQQNVTHASKVSPSASPVLGLSFLGSIVGLSYQWQIDVNDPRRSTHQFFVGVEF